MHAGPPSYGMAAIGDAIGTSASSANAAPGLPPQGAAASAASARHNQTNRDANAVILSAAKDLSSQAHWT